jgi:hypothetical protein
MSIRGRLSVALAFSKYNLARALSAKGDNAAALVELRIYLVTNLGAALASAVSAFEKMDASNAVARENLARARRSLEGKKS